MADVTVITGQLDLLGESVGVDTRRRLTGAELGLRKAGPGAERLVAELVKRGLPEEYRLAAAALVLELEAQAGR